MQVRAILKRVRTSPIKANLVLREIRGKNALKAAEMLKFCHRKIAVDVRKTVLSAISNAENNYGLDIDNLVVAEAYVGKSLRLKRMSPRAKGRGNTICKSFSHINIVLSGE